MANKASSNHPAAAAAGAPVSAAVAKRQLSANNYIAAVVVATLIIAILCGFAAKSIIAVIVKDTRLMLYQNTANNELTTKLTAIPTLISNYNDLGTQKSLLSDALPSNSDFPQLLSISQAMAADAGVTLSSISPALTTATAATPGTAASSGGPQPYQFSVEIAGNYAQVVQFFRDVELSARPMQVVNTQLSGGDGQLTASITLSTYYQGPATISDQTETLK